MSTSKKALPLILAAVMLGGCASQKPSWPTCAAIGGGTGALLGAIEDGEAALWGGVGLATLAGGYCWLYADSDGDGVRDRDDQCPNTPPGTPVDATGCPLLKPVAPPPPSPAPVAVQPQQETIVIRNLLFAFNSAKLTTQDMKILDEAASRLRNEAASTRLVITGHTDSVGSDAYNQRLSEQRAKSVAEYLVKAGVPSGSIARVEGAGESKPVADNATEAGRFQNRRVEINIQR